MPESCSETLQRFVEALLITHAETKLNIIGHLDVNVIHTDEHGQDLTLQNTIADRGNWCHGLRRPTLPS